MPSAKKRKQDSKSKIEACEDKEIDMPIVKKDKDDSKPKMEICGQKKIKEAVNALKLLNKKFVEEDMKKQPLLEDTTDSYIYLQLLLKKIPPPQLIRMIRVSLPHSLITETTEVCLITGDLEKRNHKAEIEPTVLHYKDLLRKQGVTKVSQVIPLRQLRTEYKTFESKRQLSAAYDVFLVDKKIAGVMAKTLGKTFFQSRKFPIQIDMRRPNLKEQIDKALCQTEFSLTCRGNSYAFEVARLSMEDEAIVENIKTCIEIFENKLPGKKENILSLYLKTSKSKAIPIYVSLDIPDNMLIKKPRKNDKYKLDELSTLDNTEVKVFRDGRVIVRKIKESGSLEDATENDKTINVDKPFLDKDLVESEEHTLESNSNKGSLKKKKKKVSDVNEMENEEDIEDFEKASRKKKKKSADFVEDTINTIMSEEETQESNSNKGSLKKKKKVSDVNEMENEEDIEDFEKASRKKKKKSADFVEDTINTIMSEEETQESNSNKGSLKRKRKNKVPDAIEIININELENEEDIQASAKKIKKSKKSADLVEDTTDTVRENDFTANEVSAKKKKKGKRYANLDETNDNVEIENDEMQSSFTADISPKKKKKSKKSANVDEIIDIIENEEIQDSVTADFSLKKKKKSRKSILDQVSEMTSEEKTQNSSFIHTSSKKNKKNNKT